MTMQPRVSEFSAMSAALMTCWYHSGKSWARVGVMAVFSEDMMAARIGITERRKEHQKFLPGTDFGARKNFREIPCWGFDRVGTSCLSHSQGYKTLCAHERKRKPTTSSVQADVERA